MKYEQKVGVTAVQLALALLASSAMISAHAQQAQDADVHVEKVYVTGSNIKTIDAETASPVQIIKREDIARQGVTNISDLIANTAASSSQGNLTDISGNGSFAPGGSEVSLRNLGAQSTLVLVNGRRIASFGFANFTEVFSNVDSIPIDAVERVEILKSGASAIYGSDAVAGVINIITRQNFQGVEVNADGQKSLQSHTFGTNKASITAGFGDYANDGFNILVNADVFKRQSVMWSDVQQYTNPSLISTSSAYGALSTYSHGNLIDGANSAPLPGCDPSLIQGGLCKYNRSQQSQAVPDANRINFYSTGTFNLGGGTQAFTEVSLSRGKTDYIAPVPLYGAQAPVTWGNPSTGQPLTFNYLGLSLNDPINTTGDDGSELRFRFLDAPSYNDVVGTQYRVLGGLRGTVNAFDWETAAGIMGSKVTSTTQGAFSSSGFIQEIGNYNNFYPNSNPNVGLSYNATDPNFFNQPGGYRAGGQNSATVLNTLFPKFVSTGQTQAEFVDAKITGPIYSLPAGQINVAIGGELRHESMILGDSNNLQTGDIVGYGISEANSSRNIESLYSEFNIPVLKNFEVIPALRLDKYPNLSSHFSPKLAALYSPTDSLKIRASLEHGFRAPNLIESANSKKFAFDSGVQDPLRCAQATQLSNDLYTAANNPALTPTQASLIAARALAVQGNECSVSVPDQVSNNPELKPETAKSYSLGLVFEPVKGYATSVDFFSIDRSNVIGLQGAQQLVNDAATGNTPAGSTVIRRPLNTAADQSFSSNDPALGGQNDFTVYGVNSGSLQQIVRAMQNISEQKTSGLDIAFQGKQSLGEYGNFREILDSTYTLKFYDTSVSTLSDNLVGSYLIPHFAGSLTLVWDFKKFSNSLRFNYTGGYNEQAGLPDTAWNLAGCAGNNLTAAQCRVASNRTTDYAISYTGIQNLTLGLNIINLFQQKAPVDVKAFGVGATFGTNMQDAEGRMLNLSVNYKFK
ncbi:TonB-dependent receptor domain-containing protein [Solimicrobium silvestre]|uniref:TonB-dependent Receptor Plug Domain n=1 Tax=Solimicrobium silvestre TaxID=2099400 RepID=A0A2S9GTQ4_9BURK|nr:TonB-dependent receptor [Solimicrobium silvestre]PRC91097.1 TonB-dependent Receptor Plug Domain [Solimicrobium silvestre]